MPPASREPLTPERIVRAAVATADRGGVAAVSMRKVAEALGVEAMALYHHVPNKDAILEAIVDAVFDEIELPGPGQAWRAAIERRCWSARSVLARHSWVLGLIESRDHVGPHRLRHHDAVLGVFIEAGFAPVDAVLAVSAVDSYVYGFVLQEQQQVAAPDETEQLADDLVKELSDADLPHLRAVALAVAAGPAPTHDDAFAHGLGVVLAGLGT
jgi:AcrR family transcriptional regulator